MINYINRLLLSLLLTTLLASTVQADFGYKRTLPDGSVEFSDQPATDAEPISLIPVQSYSAPKPQMSPEEVATPAPPPTPAVARVAYRSLTITAPVQDSNLMANDQRLNLQLAVEPALAEGDSIAIEYDGQEVARGAQTQFTLKDVYRGTHHLRAHIYNAEGERLLSSAELRVHTRQRSILH